MQRAALDGGVEQRGHRRVEHDLGLRTRLRRAPAREHSVERFHGQRLAN